MEENNELNTAKKIFGDNFTTRDLNKLKKQSIKSLNKTEKETKKTIKINNILEKINDDIIFSEKHILAKNIFRKCLVELNKLHANHDSMNRIIICMINGNGIVGLINDYWDTYIEQYNNKINELGWLLRKRYKLDNYKLRSSKNKLEDILNIKVIENDKIFPKQIKIEIIALKTQFQCVKKSVIDDVETLSLQIVDKPLNEIKKTIKLNPKTFEILN